MDQQTQDQAAEGPAPVAFKAETRQILDILIHSLYTEREIFLREMISNASDALTRIGFEILTNREVLDPDAELAIRIIPDAEENTLTIEDSGIGMTQDELIRNLGTIAQSGAREFLQAAGEKGQDLSNLIGQFGVGFYSAFMVAEWIRVTSRSYQKEAQAAAWFSRGEDTFTVEPAEREARGSSVTIKLKQDASEFTQEHRLREIVRKHSDFIPFPIYIGDQAEQVNRQTAIWRQSPREVKPEDYDEFYKQLTLNFEAPLTHTHLAVDAPAQMYAILYVPSDPERSIFSPRKEPGLKLYARKVMIQEYNKDLLPEYLGFIQGVVDSEDLPLNVSREAVQSSRVMGQLKKLVTSKAIDMLEKLAQDDPEKYIQFWGGYARYIKQGVAIEQAEPEALYPLLRFRTTSQPDRWSSLDEYVERMKDGQEQIYYIMGDDPRSALYSPHLDIVRHYDYEVLLFTDPIDAFMLVRLNQYKEREFSNVATANLALPEGEKEKADEATPPLPDESHAALLERFKTRLGERVTDVRMTDRLSDSPARLVDPQGALNQEMQRVYRLLNRDFEAPKKVLELNPRHQILLRLNALPEDDPLSTLVIEQIYEDALLIEGLHPDPASMISRIQKLIEAALV
ncbi:MAG: molecular chaperone HtpG [Anaerolineales bacterium]|nr:molecular chaperone HtpG [Anaerolineales bacterium]